MSLLLASHLYLMPSIPLEKEQNSLGMIGNAKERAWKINEGMRKGTVCQLNKPIEDPDEAKAMCQQCPA